ncbi:hypothetical protein D3C80_1663950 [compost metagenome]
MLIFHHFEVAGYQIDPVEIGLADDIADWPALGVVVAKSSVDRFVGTNVKLRLRAEQCRK